MNIRLFMALLNIYQYNFKLLHWNASSEEFHTQHDWAASYYDKLQANIDEVAEIAHRLDLSPVGFKETYDIIDSSDGKYLVLENNKDFELKDFCKSTDIMFKDLCKAIEELLASELINNPSNVGIKSYFENLHNEYDHQYRYVNKRRMKD